MISILGKLKLNICVLINSVLPNQVKTIYKPRQNY